MSETLLHDPTTGFNDLKPLPTESIQVSYSMLLLVICLVLLLFYLFRLFLKRKKTKRIDPTPSRDFLGELQRISFTIQNGTLPPGEVASELSLLLRSYLEQRRGIEAVEKTTRELQRELATSTSFSEMERRTVLEIVSECEQIAFSDSHSGELLPLVEQTKQVLSGRSV